MPIIQARHKKTGVSIDMVIDREDGLQGLCLVSSLIDTFPELQPLYMVIKAFLVSKNVHKPWKGGMGSFVLVNLLTIYIQKVYKKRVKTGSIDQPLQELVIGFLNFLGNDLKHK